MKELEKHHLEALELLGPTPTEKGYIKKVNVSIDNKIKEMPKGKRYNVVVMQSFLYPDQGEWVKQITPGTSIDFGGTPVVAVAQNTTYPQGVKGFIRLAVDGNQNADVEFFNYISGYSGSLNGSTSIYIGNYLFSVKVTVQDGTLNVDVSTIKYCQ